MAAGMVGRDAELASLHDFVASVSDGAAALVLGGEAGMGKTTLWASTVDRALERGLRVLEARPAESEIALSFSGIGDLLDPVLDEALAPLPAPQRRALSRALMLEDADGPAPDPHAVGVAVLNVLRGLAQERPVLVAVDDVQWLDGASSDALAYAVRRLRAEPVGVLMSHRTPLESVLLAEVQRSLPGERFRRIEVGPLDHGALQRAVQEHLELVLPRPVLAEVHEASGGNPFYALEIVRMLQRRGISGEAGQPLPVPDSLHDLVHGRLLALPPDSRHFVLAAAAHAHPTIAVTETASGVGRHAGLTPALEARIVELDRDAIRFTHPLLAAGALEIADPARRAEVHARLAELLENPEARAWQLAASVDQPDEAVATALEEAARHAQGRGALRPAALMLDRASELTPLDRPDDRLRRAVDAAFLHFESGDARRGQDQISDVISRLGPGRDRARALLVLAYIRRYDAADEAADLFLQVLEEAEGDREILAGAHEGVSSCRWWVLERLDDAVEHAEVAVKLALEIGDEALAADALMAQLGAEGMLGRPTALATVERALVLQTTAADRRVLDQPLVAISEYWTWTDAYERARAALGDLLRRAQELGDESSRPYLLFILGDVERIVGNLESAVDRARAGQAAAEQSGQDLFAAHNLALEGFAQAQLGRPERARQAAQRALELAPRSFVVLIAPAALGHLELALGAPDATVAQLGPRVAFVRAEGVVEPGVIRFVVDQVEALIELGRQEEAEELLAWYEQNAKRLGRVSALANCARCRGLLAASLEDAVAAYEEALEWHAQVDLPLDRGRTLLALGAAQRRAKRRREARETLEEALRIFESIGAALWAERARAELRRISGRAATPGALTPAEERVAALVADGKTNREVAAALFLSERTVEGHLSRVFGKLGIKHRAEVAAALAGESNTGDAAVKHG